MAMVVSALGLLAAHRFVPSSGSTAMSISSPPRPSSSPMKSMGASSRSPSPMTMRPEKSISLNASRMAVVAAWSAATLSPLPLQAADAMAAFSATVRISMIRAGCMCGPFVTGTCLRSKPAGIPWNPAGGFALFGGIARVG